MKKTIKLTENDLQRLVKKILKESDTNPYDELRKFLNDSFYFEDYGIPEGRNKFETFYNIFVDEYGWEIKRRGEKGALVEYLLGLPSAIDIPYYYNDIENLLYSLGFDEVKEMEDDQLSKFFFDMVAEIILKNK